MYLFNIIDYSDLIRGKKIMEVGRVKDRECGECGRRNTDRKVHTCNRDVRWAILVLYECPSWGSCTRKVTKPP